MRCRWCIVGGVIFTFGLVGVVPQVLLWLASAVTSFFFRLRASLAWSRISLTALEGFQQTAIQNVFLGLPGVVLVTPATPLHVVLDTALSNSLLLYALGGEDALADRRELHDFAAVLGTRCAT